MQLGASWIEVPAGRFVCAGVAVTERDGRTSFFWFSLGVGLVRAELAEPHGGEPAGARRTLTLLRYRTRV